MKKFSLFIVAAAVLASTFALQGCGMSNNFSGPLAAIANRRDYPVPVQQMSYAPNDPAFVGYVGTRVGTDTHTFKTGDRSFVMRGTPPLKGVIDPWYDWNDMSEVHSKAVSFNDCGKCSLAMGAEAEIKTRNLKNHTVSLEICYYNSKKDHAPQCFRGDTLPLKEDVHEWKKLSVQVPFEKFRTIPIKNARIRLLVDDGTDNSARERVGKAGQEGVIWADNFRFMLAQQDGTSNYNVKLSGALWEDDYSGWETGMGKPRDPLQAWHP